MMPDDLGRISDDEQHDDFMFDQLSNNDKLQDLNVRTAAMYDRAAEFDRRMEELDKRFNIFGGDSPASYQCLPPEKAIGA
jgi:hypothetical protein